MPTFANKSIGRWGVGVIRLKGSVSVRILSQDSLYSLKYWDGFSIFNSILE